MPVRFRIHSSEESSSHASWSFVTMSGGNHHPRPQRTDARIGRLSRQTVTGAIQAGRLIAHRCSFAREIPCQDLTRDRIYEPTARPRWKTRSLFFSCPDCRPLTSSHAMTAAHYYRIGPDRRSMPGCRGTRSTAAPHLFDALAYTGARLASWLIVSGSSPPWYLKASLSRF